MQHGRGRALNSDEGKNVHIQSGTSSCPGCAQGGSFGFRQRPCQTDCVQTHNENKLCVSRKVSDACLEEITSESQSHLHSGTFLGQSGYGYSLLLVLLLSSSAEMLKRLISVLVEGCFIL